MTLYEQIMTYDVETMAGFIYGLVSGTEERILESLERQGVKASLIRVAPEIQMEENVQTLLREVEDDC